MLLLKLSHAQMTGKTVAPNIEIVADCGAGAGTPKQDLPTEIKT